MTDAPEKIWAWLDCDPTECLPHEVKGEWSADGSEPVVGKPYVLEQLSLAAVAAAYENAGDAAADVYDAMDLPSGSDVAGFVRSLTPYDAIAALDAVKAEAFKEGMMRAAEIAEEQVNSVAAFGDYNAGEDAMQSAIATSIRAEAEKGDG